MSPPAAHPDAGHTMQCMEVWGGNSASDNGVVMPGLDAWVYSQPYQGDAGGGDVHYVSSCATGRITRLLVADVSGHGKAVADVAVSLRNLMRRYINFVDQSRLIESLNKEFTELAEMGRFATAVVATYWAPTDYLVACNAGHPRPLLYRASSKTWELLKAPAKSSNPNDSESGRSDQQKQSGRKPATESGLTSAGGGLVNLPLGIADLTGYDQFGVQLQKGDLVLIYTDSIIECKDAATGRMLGEQGVLAMMGQLNAEQPETLIPLLLKKVATITGDKEQGDDLTLLLLRHTGTRPARPVLQGLLAPLRIAGSVVSRLARGKSSPAALPEMSVPTIGGAMVPGLSRLWKAKGRW
ncbi:MAG: serine/threonine-protein phosphatase [Pyrinomonadaceae bacterium]|nr:serine/threonine-protein phosphatase [Phycisphaerales bacterium]